VKNQKSDEGREANLYSSDESEIDRQSILTWYSEGEKERDREREYSDLVQRGRERERQRKRVF
jgi:hypothetical protein